MATYTFSQENSHIAYLNNLLTKSKHAFQHKQYKFSKKHLAYSRTLIVRSGSHTNGQQCSADVCWKLSACSLVGKLLLQAHNLLDKIPNLSLAEESTFNIWIAFLQRFCYRNRKLCPPPFSFSTNLFPAGPDLGGYYFLSKA